MQFATLSRSSRRCSMLCCQNSSRPIQAAARAPGRPSSDSGGGWGGGSGTVIAPGRVLTNAHNLRHEEVTVTFADGRTETGRVAGSDLDLDLARDRGRHRRRRARRAWPRNGTPADRAARFSPLANPGGRGLHIAPGFVSSVAAQLPRAPRPAARRRDRAHRAAPARLLRRPADRPRRPAAGASTASASTPACRSPSPLDATHCTSASRPRPRRAAPKRSALGVAVAPPRVARRLRRRGRAARARRRPRPRGRRSGARQSAAGLASAAI